MKTRKAPIPLINQSKSINHHIPNTYKRASRLITRIVCPRYQITSEINPKPNSNTKIPLQKFISIATVSGEIPNNDPNGCINENQKVIYMYHKCGVTAIFISFQ